MEHIPVSSMIVMERVFSCVEMLWALPGVPNLGLVKNNICGKIYVASFV